jgi:hypothetical protein
MNKVGLLSIGAVLCVGVGVIGSSMVTSPAVDSQPTPVPTVTVTASASPEPTPTVTVTVAPDACALVAKQALELNALVYRYEGLMGDTDRMQYTAVQGMNLNSIKVLNDSRQQMIDIKNRSTSTLIELQNLRLEMNFSIADCQKGSS